MSAVIHRAKELYLKLLITEVMLIFIFSALVFIFNKSASIDFFIGSLVGYLPHALFVYWYFFRKQIKNCSKMTVLYRGEGLKWLSTIVLMLLSFKFLNNINLIVFFTGYILLLIINNLIPFLLLRQSVNN